MIKVRVSNGPADVLAVGYGPAGLQLDEISTELLPLTARAALGDWDAAPGVGQVSVLPLPGAVPSVVLVAGVGDSTPAELRRAGAAIMRATESAELTVAITPTAALVEGLALASYRFERKSGPARPERTVSLLASTPGTDRGRILAESALWSRELTNTRSSLKSPAWLGEQARRELTPLGVQVEVRDEAWLAEQGFGGVLAVSAGSDVPARLIEASWRPRGAARGPHLVIVGKGITFDTGGLNIKIGPGMRSMHTDMAGGAAALGALRAIARLGAPIHVSVLVPAAQNSVSGSAMRPSDVIRHYGGRTSEVLNTDAEGRLVLADALAYAAARLKPTALVDIATLTGAMKVALGLRTAGLFATSDELAAQLDSAGQAADEPLWRMPLIEEYSSMLASDVADVNNAPGNPGAVTAALFLRPFAGGVPWAHLDVAGPARSESDQDVLSLGATGFGARLLAEWILAYGSA